MLLSEEQLGADEIQPALALARKVMGNSSENTQSRPHPLSIDEDDEEQVHLGDESKSAALGYNLKEIVNEVLWEIQKEFTMSYNQKCKSHWDDLPTISGLTVDQANTICKDLSNCASFTRRTGQRPNDDVTVGKTRFSSKCGFGGIPNDACQSMWDDWKPGEDLPF